MFVRCSILPVESLFQFYGASGWTYSCRHSFPIHPISSNLIVIQVSALDSHNVYRRMHPQPTLGFDKWCRAKKANLGSIAGGS